MRFSDAGLRSLEPPLQGQRDHWDESFPGGCFGVRLSQGGSKTFILKKHNRRITLGRFPIISLSDARTEAKRLLAEFTLGHTQPGSTTYKQALEQFLADKSRNRRTRTVADYRRLLTRHFNFTGQLGDITHAHILQRLDKCKGTPSEFNHALVAARVFFNYCLKKRLITHDPTIGISKNSSYSRTRILSDKEIRAIWTNATGQFGNLVRLCLLTAQRRGELALSQPSWLRDDTLVIPASVSKNRREHILPTTTFLKNHFIAPFPKFSWATNKNNLDKASKTSGWVLHDCRRTVATRMAEAGVPPHIIERILNHVTGQISGVAAVYNRATYLPEMKQALEAWHAHLKRILGLK